MKTRWITAALAAAVIIEGAALGVVVVVVKSGAGVEGSPRVSGAQLTDWEVLTLAIAKTESDFNPLARGNSNDLGVFQITPVFVREVNRILGDTVYLHEDAFDVKKSVEMMAIVQDKHNPEHDITRAITKHNPRGDAIGYTRKVLDNMAWVRRYEEVRSLIANNE